MSNTIVFPNLNFIVDVKPDLFKIGDYYIKWYGALIAVGFLLAFLRSALNFKERCPGLTGN